MNGCWSWKAGSVGEGVPQKASWRTLGPTLAFWALSSPSPTPHRSPLFIILTGNKIYGLSIVSEPAAAFQPPLPLLFAEPSPSLWDSVETKGHCRGGSGLAQPTGRTQSHRCEGLLSSAPLFNTAGADCFKDSLKYP